jgi:putative redox protein
MKAKVVWVEKRQFVGISPSGHGIVLDSPEETNNGPSPMELVLISLAGCTGMDVISILEKMKKKVESFEVSCEGERADTYPKVYKKIKVHYFIKGEDIDKESVERAIKLSKEKYCSVSAMLSNSVEIDFDYEILNNS